MNMMRALIEKVSVPEGRSGAWSVERFTVNPDQSRFDAIRALTRGSRRYVRPGTYTRLMRGAQVVMSDTPDEMSDHIEPVRRATGSVLINGLGLGMVLNAVLKASITDVTVVEKSEDVIRLVAQHYTTDPRVTIVCADALEFQPPKGKRYDVVWHDIWDNICSDNLDEMITLHRKYGRRAAWQGSWCRAECESARRPPPGACRGAALERVGVLTMMGKYDPFKAGVRCVAKRGTDGLLYLIPDSDRAWELHNETGLLVACCDGYENAVELPKREGL